jgi:hypothetical protein
METPGDFYAMALHDDRLRAGLIAPEGRDRSQRPALARAARSAVAAGLRALAALIDAPRPTATADRPVAVARA